MPFLPPARSQFLTFVWAPLILAGVGALSSRPVFAQDETPAADAAPESNAPAEAVPPPEATPPAEAGKPADVEKPAAVEAAPVAEPPKGLVRLDKSQPAGRMFGKYRIRLGIEKPKFDDGLNFYDELYGTAKGLPMLSVDYFPWDFYATLGVSFRIGYYTADGYTAKAVSGRAPKSSGEIVADHAGPASLTLIPMQFCFTAEGSPFSKKWLVLDGWVGVESVYWQETRVSTTDTTSTAPSTAATPTTTSSVRLGRPSYLLDTTSTGSTSTDDTDTSLVNSGRKTASVIGFAANILLNPLDEESALSSRGTLGIGSVYLSPYMEIVRTIGTKGASWGRTALGLAFTFETAR